MADILKIKRSTNTGVIPSPNSLEEGELAANIIDKKLWIGDSVGDPVDLGGSSATKLNDLIDVDVPLPEGGDRLAWDGDEEKWVSKRSLSALGIMEFEYTMKLPSDSTPGRKELSRNDDDPSLTTILYLNEQDQSRADISLLIAEMGAGDWLNLHRKNDTEKYEKYDIVGTPVKNGDVWSIPVEYYEQGGTSLSNGNRIRLLWRIQGQDTDNYREPMGSGLYTGGEISQGTGNLEVNILEGRGIIVNAIDDPFKIQRENVSWDDTIIEINPNHINTQEIHMIYVDSDSNIISKAIQDIQDKLIYDYIRLGWAEISQNNIISVTFAPNIIGQTSSNLSDMFYSINDSAKSHGMRLQPCKDKLEVYCEKGKLFIPGINWSTDPKNQNIIDVPSYGDENNSIKFQIFNQEAIPVMIAQHEIPKYYDDNGNHIPLTGGEAVIHYIFYSSSGYAIQMGQTAYKDFSEAFRNIDKDRDEYIFAPGANIAGRSILIGQIIISKLAINFKNKSLADIVSTINNDSGNTISPVDLTLVPQYLLHTEASEDLLAGDELSMDVNGNMQKYPASGGEGNSQYTMDAVVLHSAMFLNNSNNQGVIVWVNDTDMNKIYYVIAQGNTDGSITYSPISNYTVGSDINAIRTCRIDNTRSGFIWSDTGGTNLGIIQNNGIGSNPTIGTTKTIGDPAGIKGVDCVYDNSEDNLIGVYSSNGNSIHNRYCTISGNNVDSPPYDEIWMMNGSEVRCTTEGNNVIVLAIYNGTSRWREAAWKKPYWGTGRYDDQTNEVQISDCTNHCGLQAQSGNILGQFLHNSKLQTYITNYSSGSSMDTPTLYGPSIDGRWGDLVKTSSGIGYSTILNIDHNIEIYEGTITGTYDLVYTSIFDVDNSNTEVQSLMFGSTFALGFGYNSNDSNKVYLIDSTSTRTDHFIGIAPSNINQGQRFDIDIALPMITLPREYPPGTFYSYGPYKYQVITHNQALIIIEATTMQSAVI